MKVRLNIFIHETKKKKYEIHFQVKNIAKFCMKKEIQ